MKSILSVVFNVQLQIVRAGDGKDSVVWMRNKGIPGWVESLGVATQLVGVKNASESIFNFLENIEAVPAHNDAVNQEAAAAFKEKLLTQITKETIDLLIRQACQDGRGMMQHVIDGVGVIIQVDYEYPIFYSSEKYNASVLLGKFVEIQLTEPLSLSEIFQHLESINMPVASFAYYLDKDEVSIIHSHIVSVPYTDKLNQLLHLLAVE